MEADHQRRQYRVINRPKRVLDITREELIEIVDRVIADHGDSDFYLELFQLNVPHPAASDLIYWLPTHWLRPLAHRSSRPRCHTSP